jgi:hypothetical protein
MILKPFIDQLLQAKYPTAGITLVEGTGGDQGIDNFQGLLADAPAVWQHKHFPNRIHEPQRRQVMKSIKAAFKNRTPRLWVLCVRRHESLFPSRKEPWYQPNDEDMPK